LNSWGRRWTALTQCGGSGCPLSGGPGGLAARITLSRKLRDAAAQSDVVSETCRLSAGEAHYL